MAGTTAQPRADARRNRARLLAVALSAFTAEQDSPGAGPASLESIAREAGVGIGTLYRHFPSREALIEAVYQHELEALGAQAATLLATAPPAAALRSWMNRYVDFVVTKRGMADALREVIVSGAVTSSRTRAQLGHAVDTLLRAGAADGTLRGDVRAEDVVASLAGIVLAAGAPGQLEQARRLVDLLADGLRPH